MKILNEKIDSILFEIKEKDLLKNKSLLLESKSQSCSGQDIEIYRVMVSVNPKVKNIYRRGIDLALENAFPQNYKHTNKGMSGIFDLESKGWSLINKLNTNYICFCILVKDINRVLMSQGVKPINFLGITPLEQEKETERLVKYIMSFSKRIFNPESDTFKNIMSVLGGTHAKGEKTENQTMLKLKNKFGEKNVVKVGGLGEREDMVAGVDMKINHNGNIYTAQVKPFKELKYENDNITIIESAAVKKYNTDWLIFTNKLSTHIFDNKNTQIINGNFVFPKSSLIYSL